MTVSTRCAKVLTGINPQRFFGSFLIAQKGTTVPLPAPQGGTHKKVGATQNVTPTKNFSYGRRGETKFPTKFFCFLFFQEKKVGGTQNVTPTKNLRYGRRRETKFPAKFFAKLS